MSEPVLWHIPFSSFNEKARWADLTFAALIGTAVQPPGFPYPAREPELRGLPEVRSMLAERGVLEWIELMYARHRGASVPE
ncbi:MAG: hypothetical protein ACRDK0_08580 [Solirubrobacteraceae bacterium]